MMYENFAKTYYRQVGDESNYIGAPWKWYCKLKLFICSMISSYYIKLYLK